MGQPPWTRCYYLHKGRERPCESATACQRSERGEGSEVKIPAFARNAKDGPQGVQRIPDVVVLGHHKCGRCLPHGAGAFLRLLSGLPPFAKAAKGGAPTFYLGPCRAAISHHECLSGLPAYVKPRSSFHLGKIVHTSDVRTYLHAQMFRLEH